MQPPPHPPSTYRRLPSPRCRAFTTTIDLRPNTLHRSRQHVGSGPHLMILVVQAVHDAFAQAKPRGRVTLYPGRSGSLAPRFADQGHPRRSGAHARNLLSRLNRSGRWLSRAEAGRRSHEVHRRPCRGDVIAVGQHRSSPSGAAPQPLRRLADHHADFSAGQLRSVALGRRAALTRPPVRTAVSHRLSRARHHHAIQHGLALDQSGLRRPRCSGSATTAGA